MVSLSPAAATPARFSSLSALPRPYPFDLDATRPKFEQIPDPIPQMFLVVPPLGGEPSHHIELHPAIRVIAPCQAPSLKNGSTQAFHMTAHPGYTIKCPRDMEHRYRNSIKNFAKLAKHLMRGADLASTLGGLPSPPADLIASTLKSLCQTVDNKARLNRAGLDPGNLFSPQWVTDSHQKKAMEELLRAAAADSNGERNITGDLNGIVLTNGRVLWVCDRCYSSLRRGYPIEEMEDLTLPQYKSLAVGGAEMNVILRNSTSVIVLIDVLKKSSHTHKMVIHIEPKYFEAPERATGAPLNSIIDLFNELGQVLQDQKALTHLEIYASSTTNGEVFVGLQAVLKCRSLEKLHLSGIPCFLQCENMPIKCRRLQELELEGVLVNTEQAAMNLGALIIKNDALSKLKVVHAEFTLLSWTALSLNQPEITQKRFAKLESLDLSCDDLAIIHYVNSNPHLTALLRGHRRLRASYPL